MTTYFTQAQIEKAKRFLDVECERQGGLTMGNARELLRVHFEEIAPTYTAAFDLAEATTRISIVTVRSN